MTMAFAQTFLHLKIDIIYCDTTSHSARSSSSSSISRSSRRRSTTSSPSPRTFEEGKIQTQHRQPRHPRPHIAIVTLTRPHKHNAINRRMWWEIGAVFAGLGRSGEDCRAIILTGAGSVAFTSGLDITDPSLLQPDHDDDADADHAGEYTQNPDSDPDIARMGVAKLFPKIIAMQRCFTQIEKCPIPVIAAINGLCLGGGMDLASVCDVRICSEEAKFAVREVCVGLAADVGTLQRLPIITGNDSRVRELCYTGEIFTATEALELGFVSRICGAGHNSHGAQQHPNTTTTTTTTTALMTEALALATKIAANSPLAVMGTKRSLVYSRDHSVAEGLHHIATHNALALMTQDIPQAIRSSSKKGGKGIASNKKMMPKFTRIPKFSKL